MRRGGVGAVVSVVAVTALMGAACSAGRTRAPGNAIAPNTKPPQVYVAFGASETRGVGTDDPLREAWPQDLYRSLPANYRLVNLASPGGTVSSALTQALPVAESLHPALATVWLNTNDLLTGVPAATYQTQLAELIHRLRATGAAVLVANTAPLDDLPAYVACYDPAAHPGGCPGFIPRPVPSPTLVAAAVDRYNQAIAAAATQEGAVLVDLHRAGLAARANGTRAGLISADGLNPDAAGAQAIARAFAAVVPKNFEVAEAPTGPAPAACRGGSAGRGPGSRWRGTRHWRRRDERPGPRR